MSLRKALSQWAISHTHLRDAQYFAVIPDVFFRLLFPAFEKRVPFPLKALDLTFDIVDLICDRYAHCLI